jgi:predicted PurR-regulated permease PerM
LPEVRTERLRQSALLVWTSVGVLALAWALLKVADTIRVIWLPMAFAFGIVFLLEPSVKWMEDRRIPRLIGSLIAFAALAGVIVAAVALIYPTVQEQVVEFVQHLPVLVGGLVEWARDLAARFGVDIDDFLSWEGLEAWLSDPANQETIRDILFGFGAGAGILIRGVTETFIILVLAPVLAIYVLMDLKRFKTNAVELTPPGIRDEAIHVGQEVGTAMGSFVRGQLLVATIVGILSSIGMWAIGLPFWLLVGIISGVLNLIPFLGPIVGGALAFLVAVLNGDPWLGVWAVLIYTGIQQIDNNIITPIVQRARVHLSPFVIILALVIGGSVAGLLGVLVAVPVTAAIRIIFGHIWRTRVLGQSWKEASEAMIEVTPPPERFARIAVKDPREGRLFDTHELEAVSTDGDDSGDDSGDRPG